MDSSKATRKFNFEPSAMLLGLAEREAEICSHILYPLAVMKVGHVTAAIERMVVTRPKVIVHSTSLREPDRSTLKERAGDVGAVLVAVDEGMSEAELAPLILTAMRGDSRAR